MAFPIHTAQHWFQGAWGTLSRTCDTVSDGCFFFEGPGMKPFLRLVTPEEPGVLGLSDRWYYQCLVGYHPGCQTGLSEKPAAKPGGRVAVVSGGHVPLIWNYIMAQAWAFRKEPWNISKKNWRSSFLLWADPLTFHSSQMLWHQENATVMTTNHLLEPYSPLNMMKFDVRESWSSFKPRMVFKHPASTLAFRSPVLTFNSFCNSKPLYRISCRVPLGSQTWTLPRGYEQHPGPPGHHQRYSGRSSQYTNAAAELMCPS